MWSFFFLSSYQIIRLSEISSWWGMGVEGGAREETRVAEWQKGLRLKDGHRDFL